MASETRNLRKRRWKSSPQKSARMGLDFGQCKTPSPKKRRLLNTDLAGKPDQDSFTIGNFYGKREKMHFPHSPHRRKAVDKVLKKISDENTDSDNDCLAVKTRRKSHPVLASKSKSKKPVFDFTSSDSAENEDKQGRNVLKPTNIQQKKSAKKVPLKITTKKTPRNKKITKTEVKSTGKIPTKPAPIVDDPNKTPVVSGRKFFKTRSPASADRMFGAVVIKKGFEVKFVARKLNVYCKNSESKKKTEKKKTNIPLTKGVKKVKASSVKAIVENSFTVLGKENVNSQTGNVVNTDISDANETDSLAQKRAVLEENEARHSNVDTNSEVRVESVPEVNEARHSNVDTNSEVRVESVPEVNEARHSNVDTNSEVIEEKEDGTSDIWPEETEEEAVSEDLFSTDTGRSSPISVMTPSGAGSPSSVTSTGDDTLVSGPEEEEGKRPQKLFPIFTGGRSNLSTPSSSSSLGRLKSNKTPKMSPLLRGVKSKCGKEQMAIDAGQKRFGATRCDVCSMLYEMASPTDEMMHNKFHQSLLSALKFPGWKKERVVQSFASTGCRIVMVTADDPKYATKKVEELNRIMGEELGFPEPSLAFKTSYQAFLYINDDKRIEGCCVCEPVTQAFPVLSEAQDSQGSEGRAQRPWYCSDEPVPASLGVSRIWVHKLARCKGVATKLLDCVRQWSVYGTVIPKTKLAFSDPTPDGKVLATRYTGTPNFLVYKFT